MTSTHLLHDPGSVDGVRLRLVVRLDAADVVRARVADHVHQVVELLLELQRQRREHSTRVRAYTSAALIVSAVTSRRLYKSLVHMYKVLCIKSTHRPNFLQASVDSAL